MGKCWDGQGVVSKFITTGNYEMPRLKKFPLVAVSGFLTVTVQVRVYGYGMYYSVPVPSALFGFCVVLDGVLDGVDSVAVQSLFAINVVKHGTS
jgi:hypothetical protein